MLTQQLRDWLLPVVIGLFLGTAYLLFNAVSKNSHNPPVNAGGYAESLAQVLPFSVSIITYQETDPSENPLAQDPLLSQYFQGGEPNRTNLGSGIVLNRSGDVVTNAHVIKGADNILIQTQDDQMVTVLQVFVDPETDIALLQTNLTANKAIPLADHPPRIGDIVFSVGNPFGVGQSVSMGIVSATGRAQPGLTQLTDFIQTDAAINPGNSGGPLVNAQGQVIGMNSALFSATGGNQGIGFAIPIGNVLDIASELAEKGSIERGYLGIDVRLSSNGSQDGVLSIVSIDASSPAEQAGLQVGDELLSINGIDLINRRQAARLISQMMPGKQTDIQVQRGEHTLTLSARLGQRVSDSP